MNIRHALAAGSAALLLMTATARAAEAPSRTLSGSIAAASSVRVGDGNGDVRVIGDDGTDVRYVAKIFTRSNDTANAVTIETSREGDTVNVDVRFPAANGNWWHGGTSVDLEVRVPRAVAARASSGNGDVTVSDVRGGARVSSGNGNVRLVSIGGSVRATSGNGDVNIALENGWHGGSIEATSGHGNIRLTVPGSVALRYRATTGMGDVKIPPSSSDGPVATLRSGMGDVTVAAR